MDLTEILAAHATWLRTGGAEGKRAYLRGANLAGAYLSDANLSDAYLSDAYLSDAYLAAVDSLASARRSYLSATIGSESVTTGEIVRRHDAMVAAEERVREAERRLRARVDGDR